MAKATIDTEELGEAIEDTIQASTSEAPEVNDELEAGDDSVETTATAEEEVTEEEAPAAPNWQEILSQHAPEYATLEPHEAIQRLAAERRQQADHARHYEHQARQLYAQQQQWQAAQEQSRQQQAAQQQQQNKTKWAPPEYDPGWRQLLKQDEQGNLVAIPGAAPDLPQKYLNYIQWEADTRHKLLSDPGGFLKDHIRDYVREQAQEIVTQQGRNLELRRWGDETYRANQHWMVSKGPDGKPLPTRDGEAVLRAWQEIYQRSGDHEWSWDQAVKSVRHDLLASTLTAQKPVETPAQTQERKNGEVLKKAATKKPSRSGTQPRNGFDDPPQNQRLDLEKMLRADLRAAGVSV